uniref:CYCLIN domain-containing protein n=3 Tax=Mesocestoides corti TaxID=53468 RepID=A0A5K3FT94_MESCO
MSNINNDGTSRKVLSKRFSSFEQLSPNESISLASRPIFGTSTNLIPGTRSSDEKENEHPFKCPRRFPPESGPGHFKLSARTSSEVNCLDCTKFSSYQSNPSKAAITSRNILNHSTAILPVTKPSTGGIKNAACSNITQINICRAASSKSKSVIAFDVVRAIFTKKISLEAFLKEFKYSDCPSTTVGGPAWRRGPVDYLIRLLAYEQMKEKKACFRVSDFIRRQKQPLSLDMIITLADWMVEVHEHFRYCTGTFHLAWSLLYSFFDKSTPISRSQIQLYACAAILVACKQEEHWIPTMAELRYLTNNAYTCRQFVEAELHFLMSIDFNVHRPNPYFFLQRYYRVLDWRSASVQRMCRFLLDAGTHSHAVSKARESKKAAAALWLARRVLCNPSYALWRRRPEIVRLRRLIRSDPRLKRFYVLCGSTSDQSLQIQEGLDSEMCESIRLLRETEEQRYPLWPPLLEHVTGYEEKELIPLALQYHRITIQLLAEVARGGQLEEEKAAIQRALKPRFPGSASLDRRRRRFSQSLPQCHTLPSISPGGHHLRRQLISKYCKERYSSVADAYPQKSYENLIPYFPEIRCPDICRCFVCVNLLNPKAHVRRGSL